MHHQDSAAGIRRTCVDVFGERLGPQIAALARPGFPLIPARDDRPPVGRCRLGGPALLEPGTPWPDHKGVPLNLLAVLDTDALAPWLAHEDLPVRPGLLNFFHQYEADGALGYSIARGAGRVIPADPHLAAPVPAPEEVTAFAAVALHARPAITLPQMLGHTCDPVLADLDFGDLTGAGPEWKGDPADHVARILGPVYGLLDGAGAPYVDDRPHLCLDQAFGWMPFLNPRWLHTHSGKGHRHLLTLSSNETWQWAHGDGHLHFMIPEEALRAGDFSQVLVDVDAG
ncbi:DUF1963 domain-containing protein [Marinactinospora rubrisoli]|uniref:DUF1963 domain-containing protein n=1 Tax=Marinactinospora rubrisoli TaxID=2715399 RepID=A0ABW2KIA2_9ACTN